MDDDYEDVLLAFENLMNLLARGETLDEAALAPDRLFFKWQKGWKALPLEIPLGDMEAIRPQLRKEPLFSAFVSCHDAFQ